MSFSHFGTICLALVAGVVQDLTPKVQLREKPHLHLAIDYHFVQAATIDVERAGYADGRVPFELVGYQMHADFREEIDLRDEVLRIAAGSSATLEQVRKVVRARRHYVSNGHSRAQGDWEGTRDSVSLLQGATLDFRRPDQNAEFEESLRLDGPDPQHSPIPSDFDVAPRLNLGFHALLPDEAVSVGDTWLRSAVDLAPLLAPAGDLGFRTALEDGTASRSAGASDPVLAHKAPGACDFRCKLTSLETRDGKRIATIALSGESVGRTKSTTETQKNAIQGDDWSSDLTMERWSEISWMPEGQLTWDVDAGLPVNLLLSGPLKITDVHEGRSETGDPEVELRYESSGTLSFDLTVTEASTASSAPQGK